ncbi:hypothetical protein, partial [Yersinia enterocolitica]|uniref:hypothetical protein n=1 Tax=Yersinia enterocolitica TaxID=630 RepID=UPI001E613718
MDNEMDAPTFTASKCLNVSVKTQKKEHPHESIYSWYRLGKKCFPASWCRLSTVKLFLRRN